MPKASTAQRNAGLDQLPTGEVHRYGAGVGAEGDGPTGGVAERNLHPTVKPVGLMRWLVRLVTPPGGLVLDPFAGSGSTVVAAVAEGFDWWAIEREADYCPLVVARLEAADRAQRARRLRARLDSPTAAEPGYRAAPTRRSSGGGLRMPATPETCEWCDERPVMSGEHACGTCALDDLADPSLSQDDREAVYSWAKAEAAAAGFDSVDEHVAHIAAAELVAIRAARAAARA